MIGFVCAAACLPAGFGVAALTGVRPLGGLVLLALALAAARHLRRPIPWLIVVLVCFVVSHLLAHAIGAWPAVAVVSVVATAAYAWTGRYAASCMCH